MQILILNGQNRTDYAKFTFPWTRIGISLNGTNTTYVGPENGHLVIVGGNLQSDSIWQRIIDLAGGPEAPLVVIPTAGGEPTYSSNFSLESNFSS